MARPNVRADKPEADFAKDQRRILSARFTKGDRMRMPLIARGGNRAHVSHSEYTSRTGIRGQPRPQHPHYLTFTLGSTDIPGLNRCSGSCPFSKTILTGIRWTTLT